MQKRNRRALADRKSTPKDAWLDQNKTEKGTGVHFFDFVLRTRFVQPMGEKTTMTKKKRKERDAALHVQEVICIAAKVSSVTFRRCLRSPEGCRKSAAGQPSALTLSSRGRGVMVGTSSHPSKPAAPLLRPPVCAPLTRLSGVTSRSLPPLLTHKKPPMPMWALKQGTPAAVLNPTCTRADQLENYTGKFLYDVGTL